MIKDRGTMKWTAMMLPEHVQQIRKIWNDDKKVTMPTIDEQQLEIINNTVKLAIEDHSLLKITYYDKGYYLHTTGYAQKADPVTSIVTMLTLKGNKLFIQTDQIIEVESTTECC